MARGPAVLSSLDSAGGPLSHPPPTAAVVPRISASYGIVIAKYGGDHPPRHFHSRCGDHQEQDLIATADILARKLARRAERLVVE